MKVKVTALEVWQSGKLDEVHILRSEWDGICVCYALPELIDLEDLRLFTKDWAKETRKAYFGDAVEHGRVMIQMAANDLPRKIGATEVRVVEREIEWEGSK